MHWPLEHNPRADRPAHENPHAPQLFGSTMGLMQVAPQAINPFGAQTSTHDASKQFIVGPQTTPQAPQLFGSVENFAPPQSSTAAPHMQELGSGELPSAQDGTQLLMQSSVPFGQLQFPLAASVQIEPLGQQTAPHATVGAGQAALSAGALHSLWQWGWASEPQVMTIEPLALPGQPAAAQL
jgi:hypothetical protein